MAYYKQLLALHLDRRTRHVVTVLAATSALLTLGVLAVSNSERAAAEREAEGAERNLTRQAQRVVDLEAALDEHRSAEETALNELEAAQKALNEASSPDGPIGNTHASNRAHRLQQREIASQQVTNLRSAVNVARAQHNAAKAQADQARIRAAAEKLSKLEKELARAQAQEESLIDGTNASTAGIKQDAKTAVKKGGFFNRLFGAQGPADRLADAEHRLKVIRGDIAAHDVRLEQARAVLSQSQHRAKTTAEIAAKMDGQFATEEKARLSGKSEEIQAELAFSQRQSEYKTAHRDAASLTHQLADAQQRESQVERRYREALAAAKASSRDIETARDDAARDEARQRTRALEKQAAAASTELTKLQAEVSRLAFKVEHAQRSATHADERLQQALKRYEPYAAAQRAVAKRESADRAAAEAAADAERRVAEAARQTKLREQERDRLNREMHVKMKDMDSARGMYEDSTKTVSALSAKIEGETTRRNTLTERLVYLNADVRAKTQLAAAADGQRERNKATKAMRKAQEKALTIRQEATQIEYQIAQYREALGHAKMQAGEAQQALASAKEYNAPIVAQVRAAEQRHAEHQQAWARAEQHRKRATAEADAAQQARDVELRRLAQAEKMAEQIIDNENKKQLAEARAQRDALDAADQARAAEQQRLVAARENTARTAAEAKAQAEAEAARVRAAELAAQLAATEKARLEQAATKSRANADKKTPTVIAQVPTQTTKSRREIDRDRRAAAKAAKERAKRSKRDAEQLARAKAREAKAQTERNEAEQEAAERRERHIAAQKKAEIKTPEVPGNVDRIEADQQRIVSQETTEKDDREREAAEQAAREAERERARQERLAAKQTKEEQLADKRKDRDELRLAARQAELEADRDRVAARAEAEGERRTQIAKSELKQVRDERDAAETEMQRKSRLDLDAAQKDFNISQLEANRKETEMINVQRAIRELEQREREAKMLMVQKSQESSQASGQAEWRAKLIELNAAQTHAEDIMQELKEYRYREAKAQIDADQSRKQLELSRIRLNEAQKTWDLYEEANKAQRISATIGSGIEEIRSKIDRAKVEAGTAGPGEISYKGAWPPEGGEEESISARAAKESGTKYDINAVVVTGDREPVINLENWEDYENDALYAPMSEGDVESFRQRLLKDLQDAGYVFATVSVYKHSLSLGFLKFRVHVGQKGEVTVSNNRWYTAEQILNAVRWETNKRFNYRNLYANLFEFNAKPDIRLDTKLQPRVDEFGNRIIDVEVDVEDDWPLHLALSLANTGTAETSDWRMRTTVQHLNLTKRNDALTTEWLTDPKDLNTVNAFSASYYLPLEDQRGLTLYGGFSASDIKDVSSEFDIIGEGWYLGMQYSKVLADSDERRWDATFGWILQASQTEIGFAKQTVQAPTEARVSMPSFRLGYSAKDFDKSGGRNYFSNTLSANFAGKLGASKASKFTEGSAHSEGNFAINRFSYARLQRLFEGEDQPGRWTAMLRLDAQLSSNELYPSLKKRMGGANDVRGYEESEVSGDSGVTGTVEVRTPLSHNFIPGLTRSEEYMRRNPEDWMSHRLQLVGFYDFGKVQNNTPIDGESADQGFHSVGAGFRLGLTKYSDLKFDYGWPLSDSESNGGKGHVNVGVKW